MPQIPQRELDELKSRIPIRELIESRGIKLKPSGQDWTCLCPFHSEKTPSFTVTPEKGLYHCFGCERGGDIFSFIMEADKVDFPEAVRVLRIYAGANQEEEPDRSRIRYFVNAQILMKQVLNHYRQRFRENPRAIQFLKSRGITRLETMEAFHVCLCDETLHKRMPTPQTKSGGELRVGLKDLGLVDRKSGHEKFRGYVVFPAFGESGEVLQLYGRLIDYKGIYSRAQHQLLASPVAGIFNRPCLASKDIILCESVLDAMSFHEHGFHNVTACPGAGNFAEDLLTAFTHHKTERVFIAFDADEAGDRGADKVAERLNSCGIEALRIHFPKGMDVNTYVRKTSPPAQSLRVLLNSAERMGDMDRIILPAPFSADGNPDKAEELPALMATQAAAERSVPVQAASVPVLPEKAPETVVSPPVSPLADPRGKERVAVVEKEGDICEITQGDRFYRVFGLVKNHSLEVLRVNIRLYMQQGHFAESIDLASNKQQDRYSNDAGDALEIKVEVVKRDLERMLLALEDLQYDRLYGDKKDRERVPEMSEKEREEALSFLKSPDLMDRIRRDFRSCGVVGEETNLQMAYLAATSRLLQKPIHILIQSSSAAGKSTLMKAVLNLMPPEDVIAYSALTGQALFYMQDKDLKHRVLAIEEDEGAERAKYILKMLQTEGKATIGTTIKDPGTGHMSTGDYTVEGPISTFATSTAVWLDEEVQNRYLILATDESREQTERILEAQRFNETMEGWAQRDKRQFISKVHQNAQRLLKPYAISNPFAESLGFLNTRHRLRRDHEKYQALIRSVALLHQYQKPVQKRQEYGKSEDYIEVTVKDLRLANRLANEILGRSLDDMPPHTRNFLTGIHKLANQQAEEKTLDRRDVRLTRRQMAEWSGLSIPQVHNHLQKLTELEYVLPHMVKGGRLFFYEIIYQGEGEDGEPFLPGIVSAEELEKELARDGDSVPVEEPAGQAGGIA